VSTFLLRLIDWYTSKPVAEKRSIKYFTGRIPTELGRCSAMSALRLDGNQLTGTSTLCSSCPVWYTSKPSADKRSLKYFTGRIPTELGQCSAMNQLWLQGNQLTGTSILCSSCPVWYTSIPYCNQASFLTHALCEKTRWRRLHSAVCACSLTHRAHALRLRFRRTGQAAFRTFFQQTVPACKNLYL
jgi:hypothetical protein